jgi:CDP-6-deoxy-D-xylo-4-hexulose-3-dehydrase
MPGYYDHRYFYTEIGYNLKQTEVHSAIGLAQLDKLEDFIVARKKNFAYLYKSLKQFDEFLSLPTWHDKADPSWFAFPIRVRKNAPFDRHQITSFLESNMVETRNLFAGNLIKQPAYKEINCRKIGDLPVSDEIMKNVFFVGVYPGLTPPKLDYLVASFEDFFRLL